MNSQSYRFQCKNIFYIKNAEMCHICQYVFAYIHMEKKALLYSNKVSSLLLPHYKYTKLPIKNQFG